VWKRDQAIPRRKREADETGTYDMTANLKAAAIKKEKTLGLERL
jgi:hypothetical protein